MKVAVYGYADKRPVIYPLIKLLQHTGDVCFITDERHYKRLIDDEDTGHFQDSMVVITDLTSYEVFQEIGYAPDDFEHIIYDVKDYLPADVDVSIVVKSICLEEGEEDFLNCITDAYIIEYDWDGTVTRRLSNRPKVENPKTQRITIRTAFRKRSRDYELCNTEFPLRMGLSTFKYCESVEALKRYPLIKNSPLVGILASALKINRKTVSTILGGTKK